MTLIFNQSHEMRLMKFAILINKNEMHQFLCPFHHLKRHFFSCFSHESHHLFKCFYFLGSLDIVRKKSKYLF